MSEYKLTKLERETVILFNEAEETAEVFTYNGRLIRKIQALCKDFPDKFQQINDNGVGGVTYRIPKKRVNITRPQPFRRKPV